MGFGGGKLFIWILDVLCYIIGNIVIDVVEYGGWLLCWIIEGGIVVLVVYSGCVCWNFLGWVGCC